MVVMSTLSAVLSMRVDDSRTLALRTRQLLWEEDDCKELIFFGTFVYKGTAL